MNILWLNNFFFWLEKRSASKYYVYWLTLILLCLSLFFATPKYGEWFNRRDATKLHWENHLANTLKLPVASDDLTPISDSLTRSNQPSGTVTNQNPDQAKKVFRLTVPLIIKIFHLKPITTYLIRFILGILLIILLYRLSYKIVKDPVSATLLTSGLVFISFGRTCFVDGATSFNGWAYLLMILALSYKNPLLVFSFSILAAWTDERVLFALPIVILFHQINTEGSSKFDFRHLVSLNRSSIGVITAIAGYIILRFTLSAAFNFQIPHEERISRIFHNNILHMGLGLWIFFEGFWLLLIVSAAMAIYSKNYSFLGLIFAHITGFTIIAYYAYYYDITHSGSYLVPIVFVFLAYLRNFMSKHQLNVLLFFCMTVSFLFPANSIEGGINLNQPIFIDFVGYLVTKFG